MDIDPSLTLDQPSAAPVVPPAPVAAVEDVSSSESESEIEPSKDGIRRRKHRPFRPSYYYPLEKPASTHNEGVPVRTLATARLCGADSS
jgi:hypothetical protein